MALKLNVGLAKKVGMPDYGSVCASCYVESELDGSLLTTEAERFHERVREVFVACSQAVHSELARQQSVNGNGAPNSSRHGTAAARSAPAGKPAANGQDHRISGKQLSYAKQLAGQIRGLGAGQLESLASKMHGKPLDELSSLEASSLIDTLKAIKDGKIDVHAALAGGRT